MKLLVALIVVGMALITATRVHADTPPESGEVVIHMNLVCGGPIGMTTGVTVVVGNTTGVLDCNSAGRHVRQSFIGSVDPTDPWQISFLLTLADGGTTTCNLSGVGRPE